jgi:hypothetical protein
MSSGHLNNISPIKSYKRMVNVDAIRRLDCTRISDVTDSGLGVWFRELAHDSLPTKSNAAEAI